MNEISLETIYETTRAILGPLGSNIIELVVAVSLMAKLMFEQHVAPEDICLNTDIYIPTAELLQKSPNAVARHIQALVYCFWEQGNHAILAQLAGHPLTQPPDVRAFLSYVSSLNQNGNSAMPSFPHPPELEIRKVLGPACGKIRPLAVAAEFVSKFIFEEHMAPEDIRITKDVYPEVAKNLKQRAATISRQVERLTDRCWERGDRVRLSEIAGTQLKERPKSIWLLIYFAFYAHEGIPYMTAIESNPQLLFHT